MPFGAELRAESVRFRLWAPGSRAVAVIVEEEGRLSELAMNPGGSGWYELETGAARAGTRYRFRIDGEHLVPDPGSRFQPEDVHGPSEVVDPDAYTWRSAAWRGRPWEEAVIYELHVGTFSPEGTFDGVRARLDHFAELGITAVELMPIADFPGARNWGYDGVLPFAPDSTYGTPNDLKRLIDEAHAVGVMVFLDVVYNHFGPDGNYLPAYAPQFFTDRFQTPWGDAIDFHRRETREFFIHNALYWLEEYRFDGLRLDAVHAIHDDSAPDIIEELAGEVHARFDGKRHVHLILENYDNAARYLARGPDARVPLYTAQWNDDFHHACHVLATGERASYYQDFADAPVDRLARCLVEGFAYQGEASRHAGGASRGEFSADLPPTAFVAFLQNHDQVGNRAFGERLSTLAEPHVVRALRDIVLLAPSVPLLFMGEEWGAREPFLFFCDFHEDLAAKVRDGRRSEFESFPEFSEPNARERIPDPNAEATFARSRLDWSRLGSPEHGAWLSECRGLLQLRRREIVPRLRGIRGGASVARKFGQAGLYVSWRLGDGAVLRLVANLSSDEADAPPWPHGEVLHIGGSAGPGSRGATRLPPWSVFWFLRP